MALGLRNETQSRSLFEVCLSEVGVLAFLPARSFIFPFFRLSTGTTRGVGTAPWALLALTPRPRTRLCASHTHAHTWPVQPLRSDARRVRAPAKGSHPPTSALRSPLAS